jgi:hypothetical protein
MESDLAFGEPLQNVVNKMRSIASYIDTVETMMKNVWAASSDPDKVSMVEFLDSHAMQDDLRAWATLLQERLDDLGA